MSPVMTFKVMILLCLGVNFAHGAIVFGFGGCPSVTTKSDFDKTQYLGLWYEYSRFDNWFERGLMCVTATYTDNGDGSIGVLNKGVKTDSDTEQSAEGKATIPGSNKPGELKVSFSDFDFTRRANYFVLDTDYTSYSLYLGVWYEYERFNNWFERGLKCVTAQYTDNGDGSIGVKNGGIKIRNGKQEFAEGKATVPDSSKPGELKVSFSDFDFSRGANYLVLDTDYTGYVLIFSCTNIPLIPVTLQTAWILTRAQGVAPANLEALKNTLEDYGIPSDKLKRIDQSDC